MKITLIQYDIAWANGKANHDTCERMIIDAPGADVYVLPEMFSTGFATDPDGIAEKMEDGMCASLAWMQLMADRQDAAIVGSVAVKDAEGKYRNRLYFVKPDGEVAYYDKHHLFTYGNEHVRYSAGEKRTIVEWRGMKFLLQVCYDLRFPVFSRNAIADSSKDAMYDCCIYVANWPESRRKVWDALLMARALENQCYVVGVNRVGDDNACHYNGGSAVIDAYGRVVGRVDDEQSATTMVSLDIEKLKAFRSKFPVLHDGDAETAY